MKADPNAHANPLEMDTGVNVRPWQMTPQDDGLDVCTKLGSALYGSLVHTLEVTAECMYADVAAGRVFNAPNCAVNTYVTTPGLELMHHHDADFALWPNDEGSIFDYASKGKIGDRIYRPHEMENVLQISRARLFARLEKYILIEDALCSAFTLTQTTWVLFVFLRCKPNPVFDDRRVDVLHYFNAALARLLLLGYRGDLSPRGASPDSNKINDQAPQYSIAELYAKLSRAEREICEQLRSHKTEREIADAQQRSKSTIHAHIKSIYLKLGISKRKQIYELLGSDNG